MKPQSIKDCGLDFLKPNRVVPNLFWNNSSILENIFTLQIRRKYRLLSSRYLKYKVAILLIQFNPESHYIHGRGAASKVIELTTFVFQKNNSLNVEDNFTILISK